MAGVDIGIHIQPRNLTMKEFIPKKSWYHIGSGLIIILRSGKAVFP
jgi:hypothetical protein